MAVTPILGTTGPVVSSGLPTFVGGFGGTCVATDTDVSRRGTVEIQSDASEFVRLSRHGRGWTASDGYRTVPLAPKPVESDVLETMTAIHPCPQEWGFLAYNHVTVTGNPRQAPIPGLAARAPGDRVLVLSITNT